MMNKYLPPRLKCALIVGCTTCLPHMAYAQDVSANMYGLPGLVDMPTAQMAPDGALFVGISSAGKTLRNTLSFQITPNLMGSFRYSRVGDYNADGTETFDRSFDLRYRFIEDGRYTPALAIGLQDMIGTGLYSGEYIVASKSFGPVSATAGLGWGRLGSHGSFDNPLSFLGDGFDTRPRGFTGTGGQLEAAKWFRGDAAFFGGISWQATDRLTFKAEYSSDAQNLEAVRRGHFERKSSLNYGLDYKLSQSTSLSAYYLYGSHLGVALNFAIDPKTSVFGSGGEPAPVPVLHRPAKSAHDLGWTAQLDATQTTQQQTLAKILAADGITLEGLELTARAAHIRIRNHKFPAQAQAVGRTARIMSNTLPHSIEHFTVTIMAQGIAVSSVSLRRNDLERYELAANGTAKMLDQITVQNAVGVQTNANLADGMYPEFRWNISPYFSAALFDPDNPIRADFGAELNASYAVAPGLQFSTTIRQRLIGNKDSSTRVSDSVIQRVRSDSNLYDQVDTTLYRLTGEYFFRPGTNLYGRVSAGYLEKMYGGVSGELLWKPVDSRLALGLELNAVKQRDFDQGFGFQDYDVITGHASAYYALSDQFHTQLDVGRYLGGDWGATFSLDREFNNGWRVGAYATLTDIPFDQFGEGSFDKGIRITIPLALQIGQPTRRKPEILLQPLLRDGGARLHVDNRLYGLIRDGHNPMFTQRAGRFWR